MTTEIDRKAWFHKSDGKIMPLNEVYKHYWQKHIEHSPKDSRSSLLKKIKRHSWDLKKEDFVFDLGAGRQLMELEYKQKYGKPNFTFITLDYAEINKNKLLAVNAMHVKADGNKLPFKDNSFKLIASNMSLDFMSLDAIKEVGRVLDTNGHAFINLCFSYMDASLYETEYILGTKELIVTETEKPRFWGHWRKKNNLLINSPKDIPPMFQTAGFVVKNIQANKEQYGDTTWWEVDLRKNSL